MKEDDKAEIAKDRDNFEDFKEIQRIIPIRHERLAKVITTLSDKWIINNLFNSF
jgi:hypothetical protein